jgi:signal transduction histidine kinase
MIQLKLNQLQTVRQPIAPLRQIVDRIRTSLELKVVLQTAMDELARFLDLDGCYFFWYFEDTRRIRVVCERLRHPRRPSQLGYHPLSTLGSAAEAIARGDFASNRSSSSATRGWQMLRHWLFPTETPPERSPEFSLFGADSNLLIPIQSKDGLLGFIAATSDRPRSWSNAEIDFVQSLVPQLEMALHQAQLYEQTQKQAQREAIVNQIGRQTRQSFDLDTILTQAIGRMMEVLQADRCLIYLLEDPSDSVEGSDTSELVWETAKCMAFRRKHLFEVSRKPFASSIDDFDTNGPITQWVAENRRDVAIQDVASDPRIGTHNGEYERAQIQSSLVFPVQTTDTLYAIVYLNQCSYSRYWSQDDRQLTQAVADQLALSIQQAYLYARVSQTAATATAQAQQLTQLLHELQESQAQLIQSEKMSSLGQLVAGVAHEINNPVSFIYGNLNHADHYIEDLLALLQLYQQYFPEPPAEIRDYSDDIDVDFLIEDLPKMLSSMKIGTERIRQIVLSLRNFSRVDQAEMKRVNIHEGIDSTLLILQHRLKSNGKFPGVEIVKDYGVLPPVECSAGQLNQVFMNILGNAIDALEAECVQALRQNETPKQPQIRIATELHDNRVVVRIGDNGPGMSEKVRSRLFDPFFTTKPVGKGTGLGMSISYKIVVEKHGGLLHCDSQPGGGTEFAIEIPRSQRLRASVKPSTSVA